MQKVVMDAKLEWEFIKNLKVLQEAFAKLGIDKIVDINRLSKAKYQDNLEFTQWMKRYWDLHYRGDWKPPAELTVKLACGKAEVAAATAAPATAAPKVAAKPATAAARVAAVAAAPKRASAESSGPARVPAVRPKAKENASPAPKKAIASAANPTAQKEQNKIIANLQVTADALEKERDFYFSKLVRPTSRHLLLLIPRPA